MSVFDSLPPEEQRRDSGTRRTMADVLALPDQARTLVTWLVQQREARLSEVAALIEQDEAITRALLAELAAQGFVEALHEGEELRYRARLSARRGRQLPLDW